MVNEKPILSVILISHEQRELLRRCVDSILAMQVDYPYEIIISDDRSTDGTYELAQKYATDVATGVIDRNGLVRIIATQCNSDDCSPATTSQRSGWNRCNGYKHVEGKYIAHVDADDYFREGAEVYKKQIELLEQHPECSCCMANLYELDEGDTKLRQRHEPKLYYTGRIISGEEFIKENCFIESHVFMYRRNYEQDPVALYGKLYVDSLLTYHHMQFGPVICLNQTDYLYVQYPKSISNQVVNNNDVAIIWCLPILISCTVKYWYQYMYRYNLPYILEVVGMSRHGYRLQEKNNNSLKDVNSYIMHTFNRELTGVDKLRIKIIMKYIRLLIKHKRSSNFEMHLLYLLLNME